MSRSDLSRALNSVSLAFAELAEALYSDVENAIARGADRTIVTATAPVPAPPRAESLPFDGDPDVFDNSYEALPLPADTPGLGRCPRHNVAWTVKAGGVSANGKPYSAFWRCPEKDDSETRGYCSKKPVKAWADAHPAERAA